MVGAAFDHPVVSGQFIDWAIGRWPVLLFAISMAGLAMPEEAGAQDDLTARAWQAVDSVIDAFKNKEVQVESHFQNGSKVQYYLLHVGQSLAQSRCYQHYELQKDPDGNAIVSHEETLYHEGLILSVRYNKTEGKPIVSPEHNVNLFGQPKSRLRKVGLFPEIFFGYLDTGVELLDLRSQSARKSFQAERTQQGAELVRTDSYGSVKIELVSSGDEMRLESIDINLEENPDPYFGKMSWVFSDFRFDELGLVTEFRQKGWREYLPKIMKTLPESYQQQYPDGKISSVQNVVVTSVKSWKPEHDPLRFHSIPVPNGFPAGVYGEPGVKYEYRDGKLVLVVDQTAKELVVYIEEHATPERVVDGGYWKASLVDFFDRRVRFGESHEVGGYCGLYSIAAAAAIHGKAVSFSQLLNSKYIESALGSTAEQLKQAIADLGMHSQLVFNATDQYLVRSDCPVLLHLAENHSPGGPQHWVLFVGMDGTGKAVILDTPLSIETIPLDVLRTHWDGTALAISDRPIGVNAIVWARGISLIPLLVSIGMLLVARLVFPTWPSGLLGSSGVLALCILTECSMWWLLAPDSYVRNPEAVKFTHSKVPGRFHVEEVDSIEALKKPGVLVVDARTPQAFSVNRIPGAVNLPVTPSLGTLLSVIEKANAHDEMIVYCQSEECQWSHRVAAKLKTMGFDRVSVFKPGWKGFVDQMKQRRSRAIQEQRKSEEGAE